jgi:hypothetical protein
MMRAAYAGMSDEARAPFEAGANGRDVMSATEQATLARHDLARGVAAGGGMGQNLPAQSPATPRGISASPVMATPPPVTAPPSQQAGAIVSAAENAGSSPRGIFENGPNGKVRAERQADGTIKRTPTQTPAPSPSPPPAPQSPIPMPRSIEMTPAGRASDVIKGAEVAMGGGTANDRLREQLMASWKRGDAAMKEAEKPVSVPKEITSTVEPPAFTPTDYSVKGRNETLEDTFEPTGKKKPVVASR